MHDHPTPTEILESVATLLRDTIAPKLPAREAFDARVAANALDLVRRQITTNEQGADDDARKQLSQLLGIEGSLDELNRALCERIASGEFGLSDPTLMQYLWSTTLAKLAIDQPTYASYQHSLKEGALDAKKHGL
jgi:hypothetical protein